MQKKIEEVIAEQLGIELEFIRQDLAFGEIPEWDSLNHVDLILALESQYGISIDEETMIDLVSVEKIKSHIAKFGLQND